MHFQQKLILFLSFHRRWLIGSILLIVVSLFLIYGLPMMPRFTSARGSAERAESGDIVLGESPSDNRDDRDLKLSESSTNLLASGNIDLLIEDLNRLQGKLLENTTPSVKLITAGQQSKLARRLLELELHEDQKRLAYNALADSLLIGAVTSLESGYPLEHLEQELLDAATAMKEYEDSAVRFKGAWLTIAYRITLFHLQPSDENYELASQAVQTEFDNIPLPPRQIESLCQVMINLRSTEQVSERLEDLLHAFSQRLMTDSSAKIREIGESFEAVIYFKRPILMEIRTEIEAGNRVDRQLVDHLIEGLAKYPITATSIHQLYFDCIRSELILGDKSRGQKMIADYRDKVLGQIPNQELQQAISKALAELESLID